METFRNEFESEYQSFGRLTENSSAHDPPSESWRAMTSFYVIAVGTTAQSPECIRQVLTVALYETHTLRLDHGCGPQKSEHRLLFLNKAHICPYEGHQALGASWHGRSQAKLKRV